MWTEAEGVIEAVDGVLKITRIHCRYHLEIPQGTKEVAEKALAVFETGCPVAQTLKGCIEFKHTWEIKEV
ncbi:OsmC family protein [Metallumcola ferriviriculae]|uniref:OsmC family protein n=1 Tax=Metallumcola ferriviriculae TaxID=3039180 RepID=UPI0034581155